MKKILLATTMLVATASVAAAEVTVGGSGRMGVVHNDNVGAAADATTAFSSRIRISFTASAETDSGLSFGGSIRADNAAGGNDGTAGSVFVSGAFGKITMGDVDGAAEMAVGDLAATSFAGVGDLNENVYFANGGLVGVLASDATQAIDSANRQGGAASRPAVRYEYSAGAVTVAVSIDSINQINIDKQATPVNTVTVEDVITAGVAYKTDAFTVSLGYETAKVRAAAAAAAVRVDHLIVGASGTFSGVTVKATYGEADFTGSAAATATLGPKLKQYGLSASYTSGALTGTVFYRVVDNSGVAGKQKNAGIGVSYDLGGGAALVGGLSQSKSEAAAPVTNGQADIGVTFSF